MHGQGTRSWLPAVAALAFALAGASSSAAPPPGGNDEQAEGRAILDKAIKALGGEEKLKARATFRAQGKATITLNNNPIALSFDVLLHNLDQLRGDMQLEANNTPAAFVFNRDKGWTKIGDNVVDADESIPVMRGVIYSVRLCQTLLPATDREVKLAPFGEVKEDDRPVLGVTISRKDWPDVLVFFDKETGLPIKSEMRVKNREKKESTWTLYYEDYREFDGVKHFSKLRFKIDGLEIPTEAVLEVTAAGAVNAARDENFAKP